MKINKLMMRKFIQSKIFWPVIWGVSILVSGNIILILSNITKEAMLVSYLPRTLGKATGIVLLSFLLTGLINLISKSKKEGETKEMKFRRIFLFTWIIFAIFGLFT